MLVLFSYVAYAGNFSDVNVGDDYYDAISWLQEQGVIEGYSDGTFKPNQQVNRAEFLKMIYETSGGVSSTENNFTEFPDVPINAWYTKYVEEAFDSGVIEGYPDGFFRPDQSITRVEALKIVTKYFFGSNSETFLSGVSEMEKLQIEGCGDPGHFLSDIYVGEWYETYVLFAHDKCLIPEEMIVDNLPPFDDLFMPASNVTRGEMAELLYRAKAVKDSGSQTYDISLIPDNINESASEDLQIVYSECPEFPEFQDVGSTLEEAYYMCYDSESVYGGCFLTSITSSGENPMFALQTKSYNLDGSLGITAIYAPEKCVRTTKEYFDSIVQ